MNGNSSASPEEASATGRPNRDPLEGVIWRFRTGSQWRERHRSELRRVLAPGGRLIVAVNHPWVNKAAYPDADYFATREYSEDYTFGGQAAVLTYWHRPLHAVTGAFIEAGFRIAVISEPSPAPGARERFPDELARFPSGAFLCFLFFVLEAV